MSQFGRAFPAAWLDALEAGPSWWKDLLNYRFKGSNGRDQGLFIAVRNGYLNAYVDGQSIILIRFRNDGRYLRPAAKIHHKYIKDDAVGQKYEIFDGETVGGLPYEGAGSIDEWVGRARGYSNLEKRGVAVIAAHNPDIIDLEMALPGSINQRSDRIDMVGLRPAEHYELSLVFYEVKTKRNPGLKARNHQPAVFEQLQRYESWLTTEGRPKIVTEAYQEGARVLCRLRAMQGVKISENLKYAASPGAQLTIDTAPHLIIFGPPQGGDDRHWLEHRNVLAGRLGTRLTVANAPQDVGLTFITDADDISDTEGDRTD